jgi:hypothetical protein
MTRIGSGAWRGARTELPLAFATSTSRDSGIACSCGGRQEQVPRRCSRRTGVTIFCSSMSCMRIGHSPHALPI